MVPPSNSYQNDVSEEEKKAFGLSKWICAFILHLRNKYSLSDNGTAVLLKFFATLFGILGQIYRPLYFITECLPKSLYSFRSNCAWRKIHKFVVCNKCHNIYHYEDCTSYAHLFCFPIIHITRKDFLVVHPY